MSRSGSPYDNAYCESFIGKLKQEQPDGRRYRNITEVRADLSRMIDEIYNRKRLHSAWGTSAQSSLSKDTQPRRLRCRTACH